MKYINNACERTGATMVLPIALMKESAVTTTSLKISDDLKERIQHFAAESGLTPHAYMVRTLAQAVDREQTRHDFIAAGEASLDAVRAGGAVCAGDAVHSWVLDSLSGKAAPAPRPLNPARKRA